MDLTPETNGISETPFLTDPSRLTDKAIDRAAKALTDYVDGQLAIRDERLNGIDTATKLRLAEVDRMPAQVDEKIAALDRVVGVRLTDRDTLSARESELTAVALAAAFNASKEAVAAAFAAQKEDANRRDEGNSKSIDKSEKATAETIKTNLELTRATTDSLTKSLDELKLQVYGILSVKQGATENRTGLYAGLAGLGAVVGIVIAIVSFIAASGGA